MKLRYLLFIMIMSITKAADTTKQLFVLINHRTLVFDFSDQQTILDLKRSICNCKNKEILGKDFHKITADQIILQKFHWKSPQRMTFQQAAATLLENNKTCADCALKNGSILTLAISRLPKRSLKR